MTRHRVAAAVCLFLVCEVFLSSLLPAEASHRKVCAQDRTIPGGYICSGTDGGHSEPSGRPVSLTPTTEYPFRELWRPELRANPEGGACVGIGTVRLGRDPSEVEQRQSEEQALRLIGTYGLCPGAELPATTPAMEAAAFFERVALPVPRPRIEPGRLPVGFESFLETDAPTTQTFTTDTPFGPLTLTATASIFVDWDDPHDDVDGWEGPSTADPGPYPDGGIRHVYQYDGFYDVAVRYEWTATWSIGAVGGTIGGVETSGAYPAPGFEVYSRQAVG